MNTNVLFKEIAKYREKKKLSFFVGAGVSAVSKYPSWADLVRDMADELKYKYQVNGKGKAVFSSEEYLRIPQIYYDNKKRRQYFEKINNAFANTCKPNEVHDLIMQLDPYHILTTNYDTLLEQAADKYGINYSIINGDDKVAKTSSLRYIVKVHGDFEKSKFVLKEQDYLDYGHDYILIDNLMKTIMATNLMIFIGYGLNDYNIKLILNWVKQVQKDTFIEPIFIYADEEKLDKKMIKYYKSRGIRILDANLITNSGGFKEKYISTLQKIKNYEEAVTLSNDLDAIDYLYSLMADLDSLEYIRTKDLVTLFKKNYYIDPQKYLVNRTKQVTYLETFYDLNSQNRQLEDNYVEKVQIIGSILNKANIKGIHGTGYIYNGAADIKIQNMLFWSRYDEIEEILDTTDDSVQGLYNTAYYLYSVGRLEESYLMYTELLQITKRQNEWIYYYASQVNRKFVYQTIIFMWNYFNRLNGQMVYGDIQLFKEDFIDMIQAEMCNFQFEELYFSLPAEIREKYTFLQRLCTTNIYAQDVIESFESIYKINLNICFNQITLIGQSEYEKIKENLLDAICFTYENKLLYAQFSEHKNFIRNTLISFFKAENERMRIQIGENAFFKNPLYEISIQDFILIYKNFKWKDVQYLEREIDFSIFVVSESDALETFIEKELEYYETNYSTTISGNKTIMYFLYREEYVTLCYLAVHFISRKKIYAKIVRFILEYISDKEINEQGKYSLVCRYIEKLRMNSTIEKIIESHILKRIRHYLKYQKVFNFDDRGKEILPMYSNLLIENNAAYKSQKISNFSLKALPDYLKEYLLKFSDILTDDAIKNLSV